jgi:hypothetical protein
MTYEIISGNDALVEQAARELLSSGEDLSFLDSGDESAGYEIVAGAAPRGGAMSFLQDVKKKAVEIAAIKKAASRAALVRQAPPSKMFEMPMPFASSTTVAAGATVAVNCQPPVPAKCKRLYVPSSIADAFTLDTLILGLGSNILTNVPIPCQVFAENGGRGLEWDIGTIQVGQQLAMTFTNRSGGALQLRGIWWTEALAGGPYRG